MMPCDTPQLLHEMWHANRRVLPGQTRPGRSCGIARAPAAAAGEAARHIGTVADVDDDDDEEYEDVTEMEEEDA